MKTIFTFTLLSLLTLAEAAHAQGYRRWDFTNWSPQTVENLKADAAQPRPAKGWSDIEKNADDKAGAVAPDATKDNCFWLADDGGQWLTAPEGGSLKANGVVIAETEGLNFNPDYTKNRSLAIAVNYPSTTLGDYAGPQYLWLGGGSKNLACFTIPNVLVGQKIKMTVESHKPADARGIELYVGSVTAENKIGESFKPTTIETYTWENWTLPEGVEPTDAVDIIVYNTSGCHIYNLEVGEDTGTQRNVAFLYNGDLSADLAYSQFTSNYSNKVTAIEANKTFTLNDFSSYDVLVISSTVSNTDAITSLKAIRPFMPMLSLCPSVYSIWQCGESISAEIEVAKVRNPNHSLFSHTDIEEAEDEENPEGGFIYLMLFSNETPFQGVKLAGAFANDPVLAVAYENEDVVAIHTHNLGHNGYIYIPYTQETLADAHTYNTNILENALSLLANSKADITAAPKPSYTLAYKKLRTEVTMKSGVPGAQIFYTLDGSEPTTESTLYTEPFEVTSPLTVKAVALGDGYPLSEVVEIPVVIKDVADSPHIDVSYAEGAATVTITAQPEEAEIWVNLTGSAAKANSQRYTEPLQLTSNATVTAFVGEYEGYLQSGVATKEVSFSGLTVFSEVVSKFEGAAFNAIGNVLNGGYNYYTDVVLQSLTLKDVNGEDSIVNVYQPRDSMVVYQLSDDWRVSTLGQGLYYTKATTTHNVGSASGYNPATIFDDQHSVGEITSNAMQFQVVSKKDLDGRLDPPSLALQSTRAFTAPLEVSIYYSGKDYNSAHVLDILVNTDTLNADGWTKIGELQSLSQPFYDGSNEKSFRVWKRGAAVYNGTDAVFVKIASVENAKDVNIFTVLVKTPGSSDGIEALQNTQPQARKAMVYDLQGRRIAGKPQKGIYIKEGRKYFAH